METKIKENIPRWLKDTWSNIVNYKGNVMESIAEELLNKIGDAEKVFDNLNAAIYMLEVEKYLNVNHLYQDLGRWYAEKLTKPLYQKNVILYYWLKREKLYKLILKDLTTKHGLDLTIWDVVEICRNPDDEHYSKINPRSIELLEMYNSILDSEDIVDITWCRERAEEFVGKSDEKIENRFYELFIKAIEKMEYSDGSGEKENKVV